MKTKFLLGLMMALVFSVPSLGQSRIILDQTEKIVKFSDDQKVWGLEINGKTVLQKKYTSIDLKDGLFKVENASGEWNVCDKSGSFKLKEWIKATDVKISSNIVLFEKIDGGNMGRAYDRTTWTQVQATETTEEDIYKAVAEAKDRDNVGLKIHGYESYAQENRRKYLTQPRVERRNGKCYLMFRDTEVGYAKEIISLNTKFDADDRWYFKAQNSTSQKWGVVVVQKENPTKLWVSIKFDYVKIEDANNGYQVLNCYLPDGTKVDLWYDGSTTEQKTVPIQTEQ
jgi:hypothetical protein